MFGFKIRTKLVSWTLVRGRVESWEQRSTILGVWIWTQIFRGKEFPSSDLAQMKELGCWAELFFSIADLAEPSYLSSRAGLRLLWSKTETKYGPVWGWWPQRKGLIFVEIVECLMEERERLRENWADFRISASCFTCQAIQSISKSDSDT